VTGIHNIVTDLTAKRLELLHELVPGLRRVVTFYDPSNASARPAIDIARDAARQLAIELIERQVTSVEHIHDSLRALHRADADAFFFVSDAMVISQAVPIIERANALGIPTMATYTDLLGSGALIAYGVSFRDQGRRVAAYVVRILGGTRPGDLPVEGINVPSLAINRGAARALQIQIPEAVLARADEVIE
jgi:putative ABC transport system substrate-binding protein